MTIHLLPLLKVYHLKEKKKILIQILLYKKTKGLCIQGIQKKAQNKGLCIQTIQEKAQYGKSASTKKAQLTKVFYLVKITKCTRWCRESLLSYCTYTMFHAKAEPGLRHYPFQNHLQTIRAVAKCHKVRRLTWRYIWMDAYLFQNKREKRSQPQQSNKKKRKHLKIKFYLYRVTASY